MRNRILIQFSHFSLLALASFKRGMERDKGGKERSRKRREEGEKREGRER